MLPPHTLAATTLSELRVGRELNVEVDLLARYVARYLDATSGNGTSSDERLTRALKRAGMM